MHTMNVYFSVVVTSNAHCKDIAYLSVKSKLARLYFK